MQKINGDPFVGNFDGGAHDNPHMSVPAFFFRRWKVNKDVAGLNRVMGKNGFKMCRNIISRINSIEKIEEIKRPESFHKPGINIFHIQNKMAKLIGNRRSRRMLIQKMKSKSGAVHQKMRFAILQRNFIFMRIIGGKNAIPKVF